MSCEHGSDAGEEVVLWDEEADYLELDGHDCWWEEYVSEEVGGYGDYGGDWVSLLCEYEDACAYHAEADEGSDSEGYDYDGADDVDAEDDAEGEDADS